MNIRRKRSLRVISETAYHDVCVFVYVCVSFMEQRFLLLKQLDFTFFDFLIHQIF